MLSAMDETLGAGSLLGRETRGEVVLVDRWRSAMWRRIASLPPEALQTAIEALTRARSAMPLAAANR